MKYISFDRIYETDYSLEQVIAFPQHFEQGGSFQTTDSGRPDSGLMYVSNCENIMTSDNKIFHAKIGQIVYLPQGYKYRAYFSKSPNTSLNRDRITDYLINFTAKTPSGEDLALSDEIIVFTPNDSTYFKEMFEYTAKKCENAMYPPAMLKAAVFELITEASKQFKGNAVFCKNDVILTSAIKYISENCFKKEISVSELSEISHISESSLRRIFHTSLNMSPKEYINMLKIKRAKLLLKSGSLSVAEISRLIGFEDASYFSRFFKKQTGINPTKYR